MMTTDSKNRTNETITYDELNKYKVVTITSGAAVLLGDKLEKIKTEIQNVSNWANISSTDTQTQTNFNQNIDEIKNLITEMKSILDAPINAILINQEKSSIVSNRSLIVGIISVIFGILGLIVTLLQLLLPFFKK